VRVATYNLHAGVDGWGRLTNARDTVLGITPNLIFLQELWRGDASSDSANDDFIYLCEHLRLEGHYEALAQCKRVTGGTGGKSWSSPLGLIFGDRGLFYLDGRPLSKRRRRLLEQSNGVESGTWGTALLTTLRVKELRTIDLPARRRDKVRRVLIVARLNDGTHSFYAVAVHGPHLSHGSLLQYRQIARELDSLSHELPILVGGDFNCWRPLLRVVLPKWRTLVRARTWPAHRPHSQIDHLLSRGPWHGSNARTVRGTSDHRALVVDLTLN